MDKRTLIFLLLITVSILLMQNFLFDRHETAPSPTEEVVQESLPPVNGKTISSGDLPLVALYTDTQKSSFFAKGLVFNDTVLVNKISDVMPKNLYYSPDSNAPLKEIFIEHPSQEILWLALYSDHAEGPHLDSFYLPQGRIVELQFVVLGAQGKPARIIEGKYENQHVFFPHGTPEENAIALLPREDKLVPVGYYDASSKRFIDFTDLPSVVAYTSFQSLPELTLPDQGNHYVLENAFMQVVFSTIGGAITEINLPFQSKENPASVVKPIGIDREIAKDSPDNDLFPVYPSYAFTRDSSQPTLISPQQGGYYPLLRRSIIGAGGKTTFRDPPRYFTLNIYSEEERTQAQSYTVRRFEKNLIEFELTTGSRKIIKTFSFPKEGNNAPYCLNCTVRIEGNARNLWLTSGTPEVELISGSFSPSIKYRMMRNSKSVIEQLSLPKNTTTISSIHPDWVSNSNGFFGIIVDPLSDIAPGFQAQYIPGEFALTRLILVDRQYDVYPAEKYPGYEFFLPLPNSNQPLNFRMFAGPLATDILKQVDATYSDPKTGYSPNYMGAQSFHGWFAFISEPFAKFLLFLMKTFHSITHSWGFSIILLTIALRVMLYPLNAWAIKSQIRMQQLQPLVKAIQEKHKKDPKKANIEIMQLYREKKASPFTGCLPLIIQMPFLIGMFDLLKSTFELRGVPFIPGWINNLTAPDVIFSWGHPIPFFGTSFHLLPILLGVVMYFQQKLSAIQAKKKGTVSEQQNIMQKSGTIMTVVFTVMFYHFPSGLNIYWMSSMLLSILQQWITSKRLKAAPAVEVQTPIKREIKRKI